MTCDKCRKNALALACSTYGKHCVTDRSDPCLNGQPLAWSRSGTAADRVCDCDVLVAGVQSVGIEGEERDQLVVIGDGVDATCLASGLRKKVKAGRADIVKVEAVGDEKEATTKDDAAASSSSSSPNPVAGWPPQWYPYHPGYYCPGPGVVHPYAGHCYLEDPCADDGAPWRCTIM